MKIELTTGKKVALFILILVVSFLLIVFRSRNEIKDSVDNFFGKYKTESVASLEGMYVVDDETADSVALISQNETFKKLMDNEDIKSKFSYSIEDVSEDSGLATVRLEVTYADGSAVIAGVYETFLATAVPNDQVNNEQLTANLNALIESTANFKECQTLSTDLTITLKEDEKSNSWDVVLTPELLNVLSGNLIEQFGLFDDTVSSKLSTETARLDAEKKAAEEKAAAEKKAAEEAAAAEAAAEAAEAEAATEESDANETSEEGIPEGWVPYSTSSLETLLYHLENGTVIEYNGEYYCDPDYFSEENTNYYYSE